MNGVSMFWHGDPSEVFWMLYLNKYNVVTVICVQDFDLDDYHADKFVRNSAKQCHAFSDEEEAIAYLNQMKRMKLILNTGGVAILSLFAIDLHESTIPIVARLDRATLGW